MRPVSIDLEMILACAPAIAQEALREGASVTKIGPRASRVRTHFRFPASATSGEWREIARYARAIARSVGHEDPRGVLVVPEALEVDVRSYDRFVERTGNQGYWVPARGAPRRSEDTAAALRHRSTPARRPPERPLPAESNLACFVFPRAGLALGGAHAALAAQSALEDGTTLLVIRELFSDPEALLRFVLHYPKLATLAKDPRGLLAIPASAYADACRLRGYDELVAAHGSRPRKASRGSKTAKPGHFWLKVQDLEALREALDGSRDEAYLGAYERGAR